MAKDDDEIEIRTEVLVELENYSVWTAEEPDNETTYNLELGLVTLHFFKEEWDQFLELAKELLANPEEAEEDGNYYLDLDSVTMRFYPEEWEEFLKLARQLVK